MRRHRDGMRAQIAGERVPGRPGCGRAHDDTPVTAVAAETKNVRSGSKPLNHTVE
jgi:hypothetical protein